jgi:hypothetical protein
MKPTEGLYDKDSDLEKIIDKLTRENTKLKEDVADLKKKLEFVVEEYRNKGTVEAHGQRSSKTSSLFLYRGSRIMELDACGLKLEASTVGLEACCLELEACGLTLETLIV